MKVLEISSSVDCSKVSQVLFHLVGQKQTKVKSSCRGTGGVLSWCQMDLGNWETSSDNASIPSCWLMWLRACRGSVKLFSNSKGTKPVLVLLSSLE